MALAPEEELDERAAEVAWGAAMCGLTIARYLTEHVSSLPLGVMVQLVAGNDTIMALLPLVDRPPWSRHNKGQVRQRRVARALGQAWAGSGCRSSSSSSRAGRPAEREIIATKQPSMCRFPLVNHSLKGSWTAAGRWYRSQTTTS